MINFAVKGFTAHGPSWCFQTIRNIFTWRNSFPKWEKFHRLGNLHLQGKRLLEQNTNNNNNNNNNNNYETNNLSSYTKGRVRLESIRNKNNWNNASKRLFGSYSHSGIPGFPFRLFYSQEQNSRNIFGNIFGNKFLFRNIPNERAQKVIIYSTKHREN